MRLEITMPFHVYIIPVQYQQDKALYFGLIPCFKFIGHLIDVQTQREVTLSHAVTRTGPQEIMYRKIKMHQPTP